MSNHKGNRSVNHQGKSQSRNSSAIQENQFNNQNGVPSAGTQSAMASTSSGSFNGSQNPYVSLLFQTPASKSLGGTNESVQYLGEVPSKKTIPHRNIQPSRQNIPVYAVDKDVVPNSALSPASTVSCEPSPERRSPGYSSSSPMSTFNQRAPCSTPSPLASPLNASSPRAVQGRPTGQTELAMSPPATTLSSPFVHPEGRASASGQNRTSSTAVQPSVAPDVRHDQRPSVVTQAHSRQSRATVQVAAQAPVAQQSSGQPRRARSPSLLSGINQIAQGGRPLPSHDRPPPPYVDQRPTASVISRSQQQQITVSSQQRPSTESTLSGTKRNFPHGSNSSSDPPAKKRVQFQTLSPASGSVGNPPAVASSSRGSDLASSGSTRSPTHLAPAGEVLGGIRKTSSHTSQLKSVQPKSVQPKIFQPKSVQPKSAQPKSVQPTAKAVASTSKRSHGSSSQSSSSSSETLDLETALDKAALAFRKQIEGRIKRNFSRNPQEGLRHVKKFADRVSPEHSGLLHLLSLYGHIDKGHYKYTIQKMWEEIEQEKSQKSNERQLAALEKQIKDESSVQKITELGRLWRAEWELELESKMKDFRKKLPKNEDQWTRAQSNLYKPIVKDYMELYQRYVNESGSGCDGRNAAHKHLLEPIDLSQATEFPKINLLVEEHVNASKLEFKNGLAVSLDEIHSPYFKDIKEIVEQAVQQYNLGLPKDFVDKLARDIYTVVVKQNQAGRSMDSSREIYNHADLNDQEKRETALRKDPALGSPDLQHKLERNGLLGEMNMDALMGDAVFRAETGFSLDNDIDSIHTEFSEGDDDFDEDDDIDDLIERPNEVPETRYVPEAPEGFYDDDTSVIPMETDSCSPTNGASYHTETTMELNPRRSYY